MSSGKVTRVGGLEVLGVLLVPLLALLAVLQLAEQRLPERLVQLHDALQLLHEQQLQHPLVRVQVGQLEQLPLQDVVIPVPRENGVICTAPLASTPPLRVVRPAIGFLAISGSVFYVKTYVIRAKTHGDASGRNIR